MDSSGSSEDIEELVLQQILSGKKKQTSEAAAAPIGTGEQQHEGEVELEIEPAAATPPAAQQNQMPAAPPVATTQAPAAAVQVNGAADGGLVVSTSEAYAEAALDNILSGGGGSAKPTPAPGTPKQAQEISSPTHEAHSPTADELLEDVLRGKKKDEAEKQVSEAEGEKQVNGTEASPPPNNSESQKEAPTPSQPSAPPPTPQTTVAPVAPPAPTPAPVEAKEATATPAEPVQEQKQEAVARTLELETPSKGKEPSPKPSPETKADEPADDEVAEAILEGILGAGGDSKRQGSTDAAPSATQPAATATSAAPTASTTSAAPKPTPGASGATGTATGIGMDEEDEVLEELTSSLKKRFVGSPTKGENELSLEDEEDILQAVLTALDDKQSSVGSELSQDGDVEGVLNHAQRIACSGSSRAPGTSVLHTHEHHGLQEEIAKAKNSAGHPVCCDIPPNPSPNGPHFGVGTNLGMALLFNKSNKLNGVCGSMGTVADKKGAVVSLSFSQEGEHLAVGHERGTLVLWNTTQLQPIREISGSAAIIHIQFLHPDPLKLITIDSDNDVKVWMFTRLMGSKMMFRSSEVPHEFDTQCTGVDCIRREYIDDNELKELYYIAVASADGFKVFRAHFGLSTEFHLVEGQHAPVTTGRSNELVKWLDRQQLALAVCWTIQIDVYHLLPAPDGSVTFPKVSTIKLPTYANALSTIGGDCVVVVDQEDSLHVIDTRHGAIAESLKLYGVDPISFTSRATGTRHQGMLCWSNQHAYILGRNKLLSCNVIPWDARLDALTTLKMWEEALELAKGFALDIALAAVGMSQSPSERREEIRQYVAQLLLMYLSDTLRRQSDQAEIRHVVARLLGFCAVVEATDLFFGQVFTFLENVDMQDLALLCVEDELKNQTLPRLPKNILDAFVEFFNDPARVMAAEKTEKTLTKDQTLSRVEKALMYETSTDALLKVAFDYRLPRLACVVLSMRRNEHTSPIKHCLGHYDEVAIEYIENVFKGQSMVPGTVLRPQLRCNFKRNVLLFSVGDESVLGTLLQHDVTAMLDALDIVLKDVGEYSPWSDSFELTQKDVYENLLSVMVDPSSSAKQPWVLEKKNWPPYKSIVRVYESFAKAVSTNSIKLNSDEAMDLINRLTHHYVYLFPKESEERRRDMQARLTSLYLSTSAQGLDLIAIEELLISKRLVRAASTLCELRLRYDEAIRLFLLPENQEIDPELRDDTFVFIAKAAEKATQRNNTKALAALRSGVKQNLEELVSVNAASLAHFVFEHLPQQDHHEVLRKLEGSSETYFLYMKEMMSGSSGEALAADPEMQTSYLKLLCLHRPNEVYPYLVEKDRGGAELQYDLNGVMKLCKEEGITDAAIFLLEKTLELTEAMSLLMKTITRRANDLREAVIHRCREKIEVMKSEPSFRQESTFSFDVLSATARQMSSIADFTANKAVGPASPVASDAAAAGCSGLPEDATLLSMVDVGVEMCLRNRNKIHIDEFSQLWFQLLDRFAKPKRLLFERQHRSSELSLLSGSPASPPDPSTLPDGFDAQNELTISEQIEEHDRVARAGKGAGPVPCMPLLTKSLSPAGLLFVLDMQGMYGHYVSYILSHMVQCLDLPIVVGKIVRDNEREKFGPFKPIVVDILRLLSFKLESSRLTKECTDSDAFKLATDLRKSLTSGLTPKGDHCGICGKHLSDVSEEADTLRFYQCGHGFHEICSSSVYECPECQDDAGEILSQLKESAEGAQSTEVKLPGAKEETKGARRECRDIPRMIRRIQATRRKMGSLDFKALLQNATQPVSAEEKKNEQDDGFVALRKKSAGSRLLLAPPPVETDFLAELNDMQPGPSLDKAAYFDALTTEEVIDLFGEEGQYVAPEVSIRQKAVDKKKAKTAAPEEGGGSDEEEGDLLDW